THCPARALPDARAAQGVADGAVQSGDRALVQAPATRALEGAGEQGRRGAAEEPVTEPDGEVTGRPRRKLRGGPPSESERERLEVPARQALGAAREEPREVHALDLLGHVLACEDAAAHHRADARC